MGQQKLFTVDTDDPNFELVADLHDVEREKFLELRRAGIGGSDCSAICGLNKYVTPFQCYLSKVDPTFSIEESFPMRWGVLIEDAVTKAFMLETEVDVWAWKIMLRSRKHPFMQYSPDGICFEDDKPGLYEGKSTGRKSYWDSDVQRHATLQIMHGLAVTGFTYGYIACVIGNTELVWVRVERDEALIARLIEIEAKFWEGVKNLTPPNIAAGDEDALKALYPAAVDAELLMPDAYEPLFLRYSQLKQLEKAAGEAKTHYEAQLKSLIKDSSGARCGDYQAKWTNIGTGRFDVTRFKEAYPELYQEFYVRTPTRRFSVKNTEGTIDYDSQSAARLTEPSERLTVGVGQGYQLEGSGEAPRIGMSEED